MAPLGTVLDYFYPVEFQQKCSPNIHMLVLIEGAPKFGKNSDEEIAEFVHQNFTCERNKNIPKLINYQTHRHARTCRKKRQNICRFDFFLPPMSSTQILEPLEQLKKENIQILQKSMIKICFE